MKAWKLINSAAGGRTDKYNAPDGRAQLTGTYHYSVTAQHDNVMHDISRTSP